MTLPPLFSHHFPTFVKDSFNNDVNLYWYHPEFSQSRYPPGQGSNQIIILYIHIFHIYIFFLFIYICVCVYI